MEVFSFHKGLNKWVEVGNSGVFRPEMLLPMGLPEDVCAIAWGLSLERSGISRCVVCDGMTEVGIRCGVGIVAVQMENGLVSSMPIVCEWNTG